MMIKYVQLKRYIYNDLTCVSDCIADNTHSDTLIQTISAFHISYKKRRDMGDMIEVNKVLSENESIFYDTFTI